MRTRYLGPPSSLGFVNHLQIHNARFHSLCVNTAQRPALQGKEDHRNGIKGNLKLIIFLFAGSTKNKSITILLDGFFSVHQTMLV